MQIFTIAEFIGTIAFAISGALTAIEKEFDYYGVIVLAIVAALGGGILRDIVLGQTPPMAFIYPIYTITSIVVALLAIKFDSFLHKYSTLFKLFDTIGLATFTVIGSRIAIQSEMSTYSVIVAIAILNSTGGGMMRDILAKRIPVVLRQREIYAVAVLVGATFYALTYKHLNINLVEIMTFIITFGIRHICVVKKVQLFRAKSSIDKD